MDDFKSDIFFDLLGFLVWIPACAGMTKRGRFTASGDHFIVLHSLDSRIPP
jgi:hypothetical protein